MLFDRITIGMTTLVFFGMTKVSPGICQFLVHVLAVIPKHPSLCPSLRTYKRKMWRNVSCGGPLSTCCLEASSGRSADWSWSLQVGCGSSWWVSASEQNNSLQCDSESFLLCWCWENIICFVLIINLVIYWQCLNHQAWFFFVRFVWISFRDLLENTWKLHFLFLFH